MLSLMQVLHDILPEQSKADASVPAAALLYCERFVEFLVDLLSQAPTRRFVRTVLEDRAVLAKCRLAPLLSHPKGASSSSSSASTDCLDM